MARFMRKGTTKFYWVATIANEAAPTVAEITAGTALTDEIAEVNGFSFANTPIDTPDMGSAFVSRIPGEDTVGDSDLLFYEDKVTNTIRTALAKGTVGHVVIFPTGLAGSTPAAGDDTEVWPSIIASSAREYSAGNEPARYRVVFTLTDPPTEGAVAA